MNATASKRTAARPAPATPAAPGPTVATETKPARLKPKLVRDSFTMPQDDFALIQQLKDRSLGFQRATKKSELLRAGLQALAAMADTRLKTVLDKLPALKAGRPKKRAD